MIWQHLKGGPLSQEITGDLWKNDRPLNSYMEDVVINMLSFNNLPLQTGLAVINIHVPNLVVTVNNIQSSVSNTVRLNQLFALAEIELQDVIIGDVYLDIQQQLLYPEEKSSYINIRLDVYNINTSN